MEFGFYAFLLFATMAFWILIFLFGVAIPYWVTISAADKLKKLTGKNTEEEATEVVSE
ncbi:hypothetical protein [Luteibaculum oceani]|uniref:hypothetical protein n=1 Tax=Luteibaculum oceani TaxID=1294296 RepID=UPI0014775CB2|nr:hypothetical protein [Luteibaculum oceani]